MGTKIFGAEGIQKEIWVRMVASRDEWIFFLLHEI